MLRMIPVLLLFQALAYSQTGTIHDADSSRVLTVSEARVDANKDYVPDMMGRRLTVAGRANVSSGVLHTKRTSVFLQSGSSGIEISTENAGEFITEGDSVIVTGVIDQYEGTTQITDAHYKIVKTDRKTPRPLSVSIKDASTEPYEGRLACIEGRVASSWTDQYGEYISLCERANSSDSMVVFLSFAHKPGMDLTVFSPGDRVRVTGVLQQYDTEGVLDGGYELYPRYPDDVETLGVTARAYSIGVYVSVGLISLVLVWTLSMRRQVTRKTQELRQSVSLLNATLESTADGILVVGGDGRIVSFNEKFTRLWQIPESVLATRDDNRALEFILSQLKDPDAFIAKVRELYANPEAESSDVLRFVDGRIVERYSRPQWIGHRPAGRVWSFRDVTERMQAEQQVRQSLQEKETLLKEIHHRVKNNLQVISSLLNLQSSYVSNPQDLLLFQESQNRVKSMALIHEKLYMSASLARIDFGEYLRDLTKNVFCSYNCPGVALDIDVKGIFFGVDTAIPFGLIINELVSNSLKYAFPQNKRGRVFIQTSFAQQGKIVLSVGDDGIGLPPDVDLKSSNTLGLQLVSMLVTQLGGTVSVVRDHGTTFSITLPLSISSGVANQAAALST